MEDIFSESLYFKQEKNFEKINDLTKAFAANYCGNTIIRDSIFSIVLNYARKRDLQIQMLRYPFKDNELWAFTFIKKGIIFLCVNTDLPMCKQIFAVGHELYHIHCYAENIDKNTIESGSLLNSKIFDDKIASQEDLEANAFSGLLLMPDVSLIEQSKIFGISKNNIGIDEIITLMDLFALPYKAVLLRLVECGVISKEKGRKLSQVDNASIVKKIELKGKAVQWQQNSSHLVQYGNLIENMIYNSEQDYLVDSREQSDKEYLKEIEKRFWNQK